LNAAVDAAALVFTTIGIVISSLIYDCYTASLPRDSVF
jgi:hypothetical protein